MQEFPLKTAYHFCCYFLLFFLLVVVSGGVVAVVVIAVVIVNADVVVSFLLVLLLLLVSLIFVVPFSLLLRHHRHLLLPLDNLQILFPAVSTFQTDSHKRILIIVLGQTVNAKRRRANEGKLAVLTALRRCFWQQFMLAAGRH